jgi:hypothetical protein
MSDVRRCHECKKSMIPHTKFNDWLLLANFLYMQLSEEYITSSTYEIMMDALLSFKGYAMEEDDALELSNHAACGQKSSLRPDAEENQP